MTSVFILLDLVAKTLIMTSSTLVVFFFLLPDLMKRFNKIETETKNSLESPYNREIKPKPKTIKKEGNLIVGNFNRRSVNR